MPTTKSDDALVVVGGDLKQPVSPPTRETDSISVGSMPAENSVRFLLSHIRQTARADFVLLAVRDTAGQWQLVPEIGTLPNSEDALHSLPFDTEDVQHLVIDTADLEEAANLIPTEVSALSSFPLQGSNGRKSGILLLGFNALHWHQIDEIQRHAAVDLLTVLAELLSQQVKLQCLEQHLALAADWIWESDAATGTFRETATRFTDTAGHPRCSARPFDLILSDPKHKLRHESLMEGRSSFKNVRYTLDNSDTPLSFSVDGEPVFDGNGNHTGFRGVVRDVTAEEAQNLEIGYLATHDPLTGLANRAAFTSCLTDAFEAWLENGDRATLFHLDLDNFKPLNDTYGHAFGDQILIAIARRLDTVPSMEATIARLGGDEFAIFDPALFTRPAIEECARKIVDVLAEPLVIAGTQVRLGGSVGISILPEDGANAELLLGNADLALYEAKRAGRNRFQFYDSTMRQKVEARERTRNAIGQGHRRGELGTAYLGIRELGTDAILGAEAILTWQNAEGIPSKMRTLRGALAQTDEAMEIGNHFVRSACEQMSRWNRTLGRDMVVSVALNPVQAKDPDLARNLLTIVEETELGYANLQVNILPESLRGDSGSLTRNLLQLSEQDVILGLVDYGSLMVSPFHYVSSGITHLNLDLSQIDPLKHRSSVSSLGAALVGFATQLGCEVCISGYQSYMSTAELLEIGGKSYSNRSMDFALTPDAFGERLAAIS